MHTDWGRNIVDGSINKQIPVCRALSVREDIDNFLFVDLIEY